MTGSLLSVRDLEIVFRIDGQDVPVVRDLSFDIEAGETLGIVGESGCGKSITALSLLGLVPNPPGRISKGQILFEGEDLTQAGEARLNAVRGNDISMVFQEPMTSLNPVFTVGTQIVENLALHRKASRRAAHDRAVELMRLVGIPSPEKRFHSYPHELSGGMRQRVLIAMALTCDPSLLIADEPTTALDVTIQAQILDLIVKLRDQFGMAVMFITHDLGVVAEICDEVAVMYGGQIVEAGPVGQVLAAPGHPYTRALMACIPRLGMDRSEKLNSIPGIVPSPKAWPQGCRFANRCASVRERCRKQQPPKYQRGEGFFACWLGDAEADDRETAHG